jgi:putative ABC transport system permease protein
MQKLKRAPRRRPLLPVAIIRHAAFAAQNSFRALDANKLRSALTMLGAIIGVMCVVALVNIGLSGRQYMQQSLSAVGRNLVFVEPRYDPDAENPPSHWRPLNMSDVRAIESGCTLAAGVCPQTETSTQASFDHFHIATRVCGVLPNFLELRNWKLAHGAGFTHADVQSRACVCVLGRKVADTLFGNMAAIKQSVHINRQSFTVAGVLEAKGALLSGGDQDNLVLIPITTAQERLTGERTVSTIYVSAQTSHDVEGLKDQIRSAVRRSHRLPAGTRDDVETRDLGELSRLVDNVMFSATALLSSIAMIALLIGGIGIMNTMLVSVMERTYEIGLRMAVGAKRRDILSQFLCEAMALSITGGALGALLGVALSSGVAAHFNWPIALSGVSIGGAIAFSAIFGAFFGSFPAYRASRLDPIEALRAA